MPIKYVYLLGIVIKQRVIVAFYRENRCESITRDRVVLGGWEYVAVLGNGGVGGVPRQKRGLR